VISAEFRAELERRRERVLSGLGQDALVLFSAPVQVRNNDVEQPYRQHSDFFYLTGFPEPEAALVLRREAPGYVLFVRPRDPERETWDGRRAGVEGAMAEFGAATAYPIGELEARLPDLLAGAERVHYPLGEHRPWDEQLLSTLGALRRRRRTRIAPPSSLVDSGVLLHELRLIKSEFELAAMRRASQLAAAGHRRAMQACRPGMTEYQLAAELEFVFRKGGSGRNAYESIVGGGDNATILHYRENESELRASDVVLIDAGAELGHYASDITRTFPVDGTFRPAARRLYQLVLDAQKAALSECRVGKTLDDVHEAARATLQKGLVALGLASGTDEEQRKRTLELYMHRTSHYLGMDVHDVGRYAEGGALVPLRAGMVITVEPGLYIPLADTKAPEEYRGIGIRIEDDVVICAGAPEILTSDVPREVEEIEALCQGGRLAAE